MKKIFVALMTICLVLGLWAHPTTAYAEGQRLDYSIMINRAANCVTIYTQNEIGEFTVPVIAFACSTGRDNKTNEGTFTTTDQYTWRKMKGGVFSQYATRFNGHQLLHSVTYVSRSADRLQWEQYNKLGEQASAGCVRLACADAKWIYDHCGPGTQVVVYDDAENPGPLGKPASVKIAADHPYKNWDPTDPNPNNPWVEVLPRLQLTANTQGDNVLYLSAGASPETLRASIGLFTADGLPYSPETYSLGIYGRYDLNTAGTYELSVRGFDLATGLRADLTVTLVVSAPVAMAVIAPVAAQ